MKLNRFAAVTDIHGNLPALQAVIAEIEAAGGVEAVVNLGDIVSGPLWPRETAALLMSLGWPTIAGNHERQALAAYPGPHDDDAFAAAELLPPQKAWLAALPPLLALDDGQVQLVHGTPSSDLAPLLETIQPGHAPGGNPGRREASLDEVRARLEGHTAGLVLCGHTHLPRVMQVGRTLVVNPGSLGRPAYDARRPLPHRAECGSPHARWALLERRPGGWQVQLRCTVYDWETAAARAASLGFEDWAFQLRTGRVGPREAAALGGLG